MSKTRTIKVKYFDNEIDRISKIDKGDWIDLRAAETVELQAGESTLIPLGVGMMLPKKYEAHIVPRSSTFKTYGILQANSMGVIDNSYRGEDDQWYFPAYATRPTTVHKNDRICQFRIQKKQPKIEFEEVEHLEAGSRGGFGSTGIATYDEDDDEYEEDEEYEDDELEIPDNECKAVQRIYIGFGFMYINLYLKASDNYGRDDIEYYEERYKRGMMRAFKFLFDRSEEFSGEARVKRKQRIRAMAKCFLDILEINFRFLELEAEDVGHAVMSRFEKVLKGIADIYGPKYSIDGDRSRIGDTDAFRERYAAAVRGLSDILGEDNILATREHIDNMVVAYEFFIDAEREYSLKEEQYESD